MSTKLFGHGLTARDHRREILYQPKKRPGFVAWTTAFDYGDGRVGLSFNETLRAPNKDYTPPRLELGEAIGAPVSYCSVFCGSENEVGYRVYMASGDGGASFYETGRCLLSEGSFCNVGFPDGRIVGLDVSRENEERTGWFEGILVRESLDGGASWNPVSHLLPDTAPYLWRVRRLADGTIVVLACLYGTPWGKGKDRGTRNTMLPGESYLNKIQTFFLTSRDGVSFSGPHYILPGVGAHEYDFVELPDGSLLFIAGDIQATPVARQMVRRQGDRFINGSLLGIRRGAPPDAVLNPQGGFIPETMTALPDGLIVGARRKKPYSCSPDNGENWYEVDGLPPSLYQPFIMLLPTGEIVNFGHFGGDNAFGEVDMYIGADLFSIENRLSSVCKLTLERCLSPDGSAYQNRYRARLTSVGAPVAGQELVFRFLPFWKEDGSVDTTPLGEAPLQVAAVTGSDGVAEAHAAQFDLIPDIHHSYTVDVVYSGDAGLGLSSCAGPSMCCASLTPRRECLFPHTAYFAGGTLYLSPDLIEQYPDAPYILMAGTKPSGALDTPDLPPGLAAALKAAHVLLEDGDGTLCWYRSIHSPSHLADVREMQSGDWYV